MYYFFFIYSKKQTSMKNNCLQVVMALLCLAFAMSVSAAPSDGGATPKNQTVQPRGGQGGVPFYVSAEGGEVPTITVSCRTFIRQSNGDFAPVPVGFYEAGETMVFYVNPNPDKFPRELNILVEPSCGPGYTITIYQDGTELPSIPEIPKE